MTTLLLNIVAVSDMVFFLFTLEKAKNSKKKPHIHKTSKKN